MTESSPTIYTVGHGISTFSDVERRLAVHLVQTIVDVRSEPYSRRAPDFSRKQLDVHAAGAGLAYRWLGTHLGGRPTEESLMSEGKADHEKIRHSAGFAAALDELEGLMQTSRVAMLCAETDPARCHRSTLIAPALEDRGYRVLHILEDGSLEAHQQGLGL